MNRKTVVGYPATAETRLLDIESPEVLAFANESAQVFVTSPGSLEAVDPLNGEQHWRVPLEGGPHIVEVSTDDRTLAVASHYLLTVYETETGAVVATHLFDGIVDAEFLSSGAIAVITEEDWRGDPEATVTILDEDDPQGRRFVIPNCASQIQEVPEHGFAVISPTTCNEDPISVVDLEPGAEHFVKNLPGFGPVAIDGLGGIGVAFVDRDNVDVTLFDDPALLPTATDPRYHLMVIDLETLSFSLAPYGDIMPRYAIAPDGRVVLVDGAFGSEVASLFDPISGTFISIEGPEVTLNHFGLSLDGGDAYVLDPKLALVHVDLDAATSSAMRSQPGRPETLNVSPDPNTLFLRFGDHICIYDIGEQTCGQWFAPPESG